jgi:hypothetical protein
VAREVVDRRFDGAAGAQLVDVTNEEVGLERVGMVVVERRALFEPEIVPILVVPIVIEDGDAIVAERIDDASDDRGLAGTGSARDPDNDGLLAFILVHRSPFTVLKLQTANRKCRR